MNRLVASILVGATVGMAMAQQKTFCNPVNVDYGYCPIPDFAAWGKHRATADPVIVTFKGNYFLFSTNQWGYWWSPDMLNWHFVPRKFLMPNAKTYDELCAPAVWAMGDALYVFGSTYSHEFSIWKSTNPTVDDWTIAKENFPVGAWDPDFFVDDDGRLYLYYGSSNDFPTHGVELDPKTFEPIGEFHDLIFLHPEVHGWQRFGEYYDNVFLRPFAEGSWMTKHDGKYYLQYGVPGTEFSGYADGVSVSDTPLGFFGSQASNPFSFKPGGFTQGAGHGATYQDLFGSWWHVSTIRISVKNNFERRTGIWPAGFDKDGVMYCDQAYGDYPTYLPTGPADHLKTQMAGWMLLNYKKPVLASSTYGGHYPNDAVDENMKTYWSAATGDRGEWFQTDLGAPSTVYAIQVNYADQDAVFLGKSMGVCHRYVLYASLDGKRWTTIVDKSANNTDVPHDYVELAKPVEARYIKMENVHMPTGKFALMGLRVFGKGHGEPPKPVEGFIVLRGFSEPRAGWAKWKPADDATGCVIYMGVAPDKLYNSIMVYGNNEYYVQTMDSNKTYYYRIEAFNENGISAKSEVLKVPAPDVDVP